MIFHHEIFETRRERRDVFRKHGGDIGYLDLYDGVSQLKKFFNFATFCIEFFEGYCPVIEASSALRICVA